MGETGALAVNRVRVFLVRIARGWGCFVGVLLPKWGADFQAPKGQQADGYQVFLGLRQSK
jgi:hypothetical protein